MGGMIRVGLVGTGGMAHAHAHTFARMRGCKLVAVADVDRDRAQAFADRFGISEVYTSQADLLKGSDVDAISNVTPDSWHAPLTLEAIAAGKHVMCEKPLATNYKDARRMADAARKAGVVHIVNFSYRNSAALQRAHRMVQRGDLGRPLHFEASYLQSWLSTMVWGNWRTSTHWLWRLSTGHGSKGVLGDLGVHILDMVAYPLGPFKSVSCRLKTFPKAPGDRVAEYTMDANDSAVITAEMQNGALGVVHTSRWTTGHRNSLELRIFGDEGALRIDLDKGYDKLELCTGRGRNKAVWRTVTCAKTPDNHQRFIRSIRNGKSEQPDFVQGAAIQKVMDACFTSDAKGGWVDI